MIFEPIWISTIEHLAKFKIITANISKAIKRGGRFDIPADYPQTQMPIFWGLMYAPPSPLILISNGKSTLNEDYFSYRAYPLRLGGNKVINVQDTLEFSVSINNITSITQHQFISPVNKTFDVSFTRVCSRQEGFLEDFLVCVGSVGLAFEKARKANEELYNSLSKVVKT